MNTLQQQTADCVLRQVNYKNMQCINFLYSSDGKLTVSWHAIQAADTANEQIAQCQSVFVK
jgi:hypothetical protein